MIFSDGVHSIKIAFSLMALLLVSCGGERSHPKGKSQSFDRSYSAEKLEVSDHSGIPVFLFAQSPDPNLVILPDPNDKAFLAQGINDGKKILFEAPIELSNSPMGEKFFVWNEDYLDSSIQQVIFTHSANLQNRRQRPITLQPKRDSDAKRYYIPISALFRKEKQAWLNEHMMQKISLILEMVDRSSHYFSIEFRVKETSKHRGVKNETIEKQ